MFLALARGLITPDYPFGLRSMVREDLMLRQLEREIEGNVFLNRALIQAAVVPVSERRQQAYENSVGFMRQAEALLKFNRYQTVAALSTDKQNEESMRQSISVLKILKNSNLFDMMEGILKKEGMQ